MGCTGGQKWRILQGFSITPHLPPQEWKVRSPEVAAGMAGASTQRFFKAVNGAGVVENVRVNRSSILARRPWEKGARSSFSLTSYREADLSAERAPQEASPRISRTHGNACGPGDPQAAAGSRPQAALCLKNKVHRRYR